MDKNHTMKAQMIPPVLVIRKMKRVLMAGLLTVLLCGLVSYGFSFLLKIDLGNETYHKLYLFSLLFLLVFTPAIFYINKAHIRKIAIESSTDKKLIRYKKAFTLEVSILAGISLFPAVIILLGGPAFILFENLLILIILALHYPSSSTLSNELNLDKDENKEHIHHPPSSA